jgi:hypothetical protein
MLVECIEQLSAADLGVRGSPMNLVRRPGRYAEGFYATVFFVDDSAIKVFKRRVVTPSHHVRDVFYSEVEAYQNSATRYQISKYTQHFIGERIVCKIEDERGRDISTEYHLEFAYEMVRLVGEPTKIGDLESQRALRIKKLFWNAGIRHMSDCAVFMDQAGELVNVIDFAMQEYELEHEPL